jgi:DNA mismatch repair protein MutS2
MLDSVEMDPKSIQTLELHKILERVAALAAFSASKDLARQVSPTSEEEPVRRRQQETTEARYLLSMDADLTIGGAHDVRAQAESAKRGSILEPTQFLDIKSTMIAARRMQRLLQKSSHELQHLTALAEGLAPISGLVNAISTTLDERGEVLDHASEALASIRRDRRVIGERLTSKLEHLVNDPKMSLMLQEAIITQRDGRFVIPLKAEYKGRIKAVIHDQSASGATLFVEPLTVVDQNNQLRELELAERDEVRRILTDLSAEVGLKAEEICRTVEALAAIDFAFARARYADQTGSSEPILKPWKEGEASHHPGSTLRILSARHPLLDPNVVVPIDLVLDEQSFGLVITGPNTGGKTVALKTAGLMVLMAQCGLHLPADSGSELTVYDAVYADIGDEQSIEQSLSTFSAHIANIIRILEHAGPHSLVLLDELGAGTDPQEGAALARALLEAFLDRRATTLVATHYPELKAYAHLNEGVRNASVEFDLESLQPTYHLTVGLPGRSNAMAIAKRLGLDESIVDRARNWVAPEELEVESLLDEIHKQRDASRRERAEAEEARKKAQAIQEELDARLEGVEDERREILEQARQEAQINLTEIRADIEDLSKRLKRAGQPLEVLDAIEEEVTALEEEVEEPVARKVPDRRVERRALRVGDQVRIRTINAVGVITSLGEQQTEVQIGRLRVRAQLDELTLLEEDAEERKAGRREPRAVGRKEPVLAQAEAPPLELDLRGQRVEEALDLLERRLDAAFLAGMPFVRVIHGKGTGRLRQAVRRWLKGNPYVDSFEGGKLGEGGEGVTVVKLAQ